jgi:hypothetical protein
MASIPNQPEEEFLEAKNEWNLENLELALEREKGDKLTPTANKYLRGVLCGYTPEDIGKKCNVTRKAVEVTLSREVSPYLKKILKLAENERINLSRVPHLLAKEKYKLEERSHSAEVLQRQEQAQEETPSKNTDFVGREDAITALDNLAKEGAKVILIQAEGGVGKTTLARKWFEHQGLKLLELSVGTTLQTIYPAEDWVRQKLQYYFDENPEQNFRAMLEQLKGKLQTQRIGVLVDNLEPALRNGEFIEPHCSYYVELLRVLAHQSVQSITLVTSREPLHEPEIISLQTFQTYWLEGLKKKAWEKYFDSQKLSIDIHALSEMHRAYGGNALAMSLLSSDIRKESQGNLEAYWQQNRDDLLRHRPIENLVQRQLNKLREDNLQAHELLCRMGFYPNQDVPSIPKAWLFCLLWDVPEKRRQRLIDAVGERSLVKVSDDGYYLHPVIRAEAVERLKFTEESNNCNQLRLVKQEIDKLVAYDNLQQFLQQISEESVSGELPYKVAAFRAYYHDFIYRCAYNLTFAIILTRYDFELDFDSAFRLISEIIEAKYNFYCLSILRIALKLDSSIGELPGDPPTHYLIAPNAPSEIIICQPLEQFLQRAPRQLMQPSILNLADIHAIIGFWNNQRQDWIQKLKGWMTEHGTITDKSQYNGEQQKLLKQYYDLNELFVDCLNSTSEKVRSHIEDTILLPIAEIEKRRLGD